MAHLDLIAAAAHAPMMAAGPESAPPPQRAAWFEACGRLRALVAERAVDTLVMVANEHFTNFFLDAFPAWCVGIGDHHVGPVEPWLRIEPRPVPGRPDLGRHLVRHLLDDGFDPSFSHRLRLDHGIMTVASQLDPSGTLAVVPIIQNAAVDPMPSLARCHALGGALARAIEAHPSDLRVALVATGGLSHAVGTPEVGEIDEEFDRWFLGRLAAGRAAEVLDVGDEELGAAGNGAHEIRSWLTAAGAAGDRPGHVLVYEAIQPWITGMAAMVWPVGPHAAG